MSADSHEGLLPFYMAELAYLHAAGREFARSYPRVASELEFAPQGSADPHVQRMIESFAFLTARLQRTYDAQLPEVPAALLDVLYPQLVTPVPSMSIAAFHTDPEQSRSVPGITVPANTLLFANVEGSADRLTCRFRTGYPVALWPITVDDARLESVSRYPFQDAYPRVQRVLRIRLRCQGNRRFNEMAPTSLRFYLPPPDGPRMEIYEMLFSHLQAIATAPVPFGSAPPDGPGENPSLLPQARLRAVGFGMDEALLPTPQMSHQAYRILQEYFTFAAKFLFFDVMDLQPGIFGDGTHADLLFLLTSPRNHAATVNADSFKLGCTPIINHFPRVSEPIRLDHTRLEYPLVADHRRPDSVEIHTLERVVGVAADTNQARTIHPLFSHRRVEDDDGGRILYHARRRLPSQTGDAATDVMLSFVDPDLNPSNPAGDMVFAHVMCTNGDLAQQVDGGTRLNLEVDLPLTGVECLHRPTRQVPPPTNAIALWRLVSHLSVNHLSIAGSRDGVLALREILKLYCPHDEFLGRQIDAIKQLSTRRKVLKTGEDAWRGFVRGTEITLEFDAVVGADSNAYLLGSVLSQFFGLYAAVNSFTRLVVVLKGRQRDEVWKWPALTGQTELL